MPWRLRKCDKRTAMNRSLVFVLVGAAAFVAIVGAAVYLTNRPMPFSVWKIVGGKAHGGEFLNTGNVQIYYETYGAGPPVLVLHGGLGYIGSMGHQIRALAKSHFVVAADSRGHGRSTDTAKPLSYSLMSGDMLALLDHLQIAQSDVVGYSDGGIVALDLALNHPERVRRLVVIGANYDVDGLVESPTSGAPIPAQPFAYRLFARDPAYWPILYHKVVTMWQTQPHYTSNDLNHIEAPTLIMAGEFDVVRREHTDSLTKLIPNAQEIIVQGATHSLPFDKFKMVNATILKFLDEQKPSGAR